MNLKIIPYRGQRYHAELDKDGQIIGCHIEIKAHDKKSTLRRVWHPATIAALQMMITPEVVCYACGRELP